MKKRQIVPSLLTSMNLLCGFTAILVNDPIISFYLVLVGIAFDFVDGFSARLLKVPSAFGKELDSLADMVSFGVVPGFLYYHHVLKGVEDYSFYYFFQLFVAALIPILAGLRLAKFNVNDSGKIGFAGLPSSAAALFIISIPFLIAQGDDLVAQTIDIEWIKIGLPLVIAILMVTNIPMFNFKGMNKGLAANWVQLVYVVTLIPMMIFLGWAVIPDSILWYIILSVLTKPFWRK